ncbi:MAG: DUF2497 domain-containing protein [Magnetospirillum sp.]|nr:DUF2497 domain-containing protein [Magnetospirillum sp.]
MSDDKAQQEPSMEDILASIRRILSEDEAEEKAKAPMPEPEPEPEPEPVKASQDDIDALFANATPDPVPPPEPEPLPQDDIDALFAQAAPEPEPDPEEDVLELTEDMVLDQPEPSFDINQFKPDVLDDFEPEPPSPLPPPRRPQPVDEDLISEPVAQRSTSLLSDLAREIVRQRAIGLGNGGVTLEDMVRELLRPILKEWLDENLPYMIERIIKKEIEKMVNRAENY